MLALRIASLVVGIALVVTGIMRLANCGASRTDGAGEQQGASSGVRRSLVGSWELLEGDEEGLDAASVEAMHAQGYAVTLTLREGGTATFAIVDETEEVTWEETGEGEATLDWGGGSTLVLMGERLILKDSSNSTMTFAPADTVSVADPPATGQTTDSSDSEDASAGDDSSTSAGNGSSASSGSTSTTRQVGMQTIGNRACGTMQVPEGWEDATDTYDSNLVSDTKMVYYVDPDSEYTSGTFSHYMFARAVQMRVYNTSWSEVGKQVIAGYDSDDYGDVDSEQTTFNGHKCTIITTSIPEDNVNMCSIALDRDGDGHVTVLITLQGTPGTVETVLGYVATWTPPSQTT